MLTKCIEGHKSLGSIKQIERRIYYEFEDDDFVDELNGIIITMMEFPA